MKVLKYLVYLLLKLGVLNSGILLFIHLKDLSFFELIKDFFYVPTMGLALLIPSVGQLVQSIKLSRVQIPEIKTSWFSMKCEYWGHLEQTPEKTKSLIKETVNSLFFLDRVYCISWEDEEVIEYRSETRSEGIGKKPFKHDPTAIYIRVLPGIRGGSDFYLCSHTENRPFGFNNIPNEENIQRIIERLKENDLSPVALSPENYARFDEFMGIKDLEEELE